MKSILFVGCFVFHAVLSSMQNEKQLQSTSHNWNEAKVAFDFWYENTFLQKEPSYWNGLKSGVECQALQTSHNEAEPNQYRGFSFYTQTENKKIMLLYPSPSWMFSEIFIYGLWDTVFGITNKGDGTYSSLGFEYVENKEELPKELWPTNILLDKWKSKIFSVWCYRGTKDKITAVLRLNAEVLMLKKAK